MTPPTVRPFAPADQTATRRLILDGLADHFGVLDETLNRDLDDIAATYLERGAVVVVAEEGDALVATGTLIPTEEPGVSRMVRVSVRRDRRGRGLGRVIVAHLVEAARQRGDRRILVETTRDWADAVGLYLACGFVEAGTDATDVHLALDLAPMAPTRGHESCR